MNITIEDFREIYWVEIEVKWFVGKEAEREPEGFSWEVEEVYMCDEDNFDHNLIDSDCERFKAHYRDELRDCILEFI